MRGHKTLLAEIQRSTNELVRAAKGLSCHDVRQPSTLPGWTRAHVLAHVFLGGEAMCRLLTWTRSGVVTAAYANQAARDEAIGRYAESDVGELVIHLADGGARFHREAEGLSEEAWQQPVHVLGGADFPASQVLERRLAEVVLHHTDLGIGYTSGHWPSSYLQLPLREPLLSQRKDRLDASHVRST